MNTAPLVKEMEMLWKELLFKRFISRCLSVYKLPSLWIFAWKHISIATGCWLQRTVRFSFISLIFPNFMMFRRLLCLLCKPLNKWNRRVLCYWLTFIGIDVHAVRAAGPCYQLPLCANSSQAAAVSAQSGVRVAEQPEVIGRSPRSVCVSCLNRLRHQQQRHDVEKTDREDVGWVKRPICMTSVSYSSCWACACIT